MHSGTYSVRKESEYMIMKKHSSSSFYFLGLQLAIVVLYLHVELSDLALVSSRPPLGNSIDDQNFCQLDLYRIQHFQGDPDKIRTNKRHRRVRRGGDKSVRTIGKNHIYL